MRILAALGSLAVAAALMGGCAGGDFSPAQLANDVTMTTTVKTRLATAVGMDTLTRVHVRTTGDMVFLTGSVKDEATAARIDRIARNVAGDNRVTNELTVDGAKATARTE